MLKPGNSRAVDQWDVSMDANAMIGHGDAGSVHYSKMQQNHAEPSAANKNRQAFKPKREVDSVIKKELTLHVISSKNDLNQDVKKVINSKNISQSSSKTQRSDKTLTIHHKPELHFNKTKFKSGSSAHTTAVSVKGPGTESNRKLNLTGSYEVLKLLSKENLVRIVNSQMQSVPSLSFQSKGSRSRKRDLIDVNRGQLEAQKALKQDMAVTQLHVGMDNQTAFPYVSPVTTRDLYRDQRVNPLREVTSALTKGQDAAGVQGSNSSDNRGKHLVHGLSTPRSEVILSPEKEAAISQTEPAFTLTKHLPLHVSSQTNDSPLSVLTMQPLGVREADSHRDPLTESVHSAHTEPSTAQYSADEDNTLVNSSHVLRLRPALEWSHDAKGAEMQAVDAEDGKGLVFEEAEEEVKEEGHERLEGRGSRSRSRRSWIWNQFFVIEEYAGPEPVLIGRVRKGKGYSSFRKLPGCLGHCNTFFVWFI